MEREDDKAPEAIEPEAVDRNDKASEALDREGDKDPFQTYTVVINHEDQYSIWPQVRDVPAGWNEVGFVGSKAECLKYIDENWTDMTPRSLKDRSSS